MIFWLKFGGIIALAAALAGGGWWIRSLVETSNRYTALQAVNKTLVAQHNQDSSSAAKAAIDLVASETARRIAAENYAVWTKEQQTRSDELRNMIHVSPVSINPVCRPTAAERKLWNDTLAFSLH